MAMMCELETVGKYVFSANIHSLAEHVMFS